MILAFIVTRLGRGVLLALAVLAAAGSLYFWGAHRAHQADATAAIVQRAETMEAGNAAASAYRDSGAAERLRSGSY